MQEQKFLKLSKQIDSILSTIPGLVGFSSLTNIEEEKKKNNWISIIDHKNNGFLEISIGIIINRNVTAKNISNEISEAIKFNLKDKKNEYILKKLNIYIKGVK